MSRLRSALPHLAADAALAAVVVLVGQLEVWAPSVMHPGNLAGPRWIIAAGYLAVGVLVAVRRVWLRRRHAGAAFAAFAQIPDATRSAGTSPILDGRLRQRPGDALPAVAGRTAKQTIAQTSGLSG